MSSILISRHHLGCSLAKDIYLGSNRPVDVTSKKNTDRASRLILEANEGGLSRPSGRNKKTPRRKRLTARLKDTEGPSAAKCNAGSGIGSWFGQISCKERSEEYSRVSKSIQMMLKESLLILAVTVLLFAMSEHVLIFF